MVKTTNERYATKPLVLESLDHPFSNGDRGMLSHGASSMLDITVDKECSESGSSEDTALVGNEVLGTAMKLESALQRCDDRGGVGRFRGTRATSFREKWSMAAST